MNTTPATPDRLQQLAQAVRAADDRIRPHIRETYVESSTYLSERTGARVLLKLENLQLTGSFKVRGAFNKILSLPQDARVRGIVAASTGNHGLAVAHVLGQFGISGTVFVPTIVAPAKLARLRRAGVQVELRGEDSGETEVIARAYAAEHGMTYVSPYNDFDVIAGQGTLGLELARQIERIDDLIIAVGGGGLVAGAAAYLKSLNPQLRVIGCQPENSRVMSESIRAGRILDLASSPTLSDGTAGGIEMGAITFPFCQTLIDEFVLVSEDDIRKGVRLMLDEHHMLVEGAAGVAVSALLQMGSAVRGRTAAVVLCGANVDSQFLEQDIF
jgi:threonine dehydratase